MLLLKLSLLLVLICAAVITEPALLAAKSAKVDPAIIAAGLPVFMPDRIALDYQSLKYNPCKDVIFPSILRTEGVLRNPLGKYYLYYSPHNAPGGICLAYSDSPEGPWTEYGENPILHSAWPPHYKVSHISGPSVVYNEERGKLFCYFHGENNTTRIASAVDGIHFDYEGVAVDTSMYQGLSEASYARVFRYSVPGTEFRYVMMFMGNNGGTRRIYLAFSKDGLKWEARKEPLLNPPAGVGQVGSPWLFPWKGKLYVIYHGDLIVPKGVGCTTNLYVTEVDSGLQQARFIGLFYDRTLLSADNMRQSDPFLLEEDGKLYLFTAVGPRLNQKIALARVLDALPQNP